MQTIQVTGLVLLSIKDAYKVRRDTLDRIFNLYQRLHTPSAPDRLTHPQRTYRVRQPNRHSS